MHFGAQLASIVFAVLVFLIVFEMVRRRYLHERYALLWLGASAALIVLAAWSGLLSDVASAVGIATPSNAFFVIAFAFLLLLLLHFSTVVSRMADETRVLAQRLALVEQRIHIADRDADPDWEGAAEDAEQISGPVDELASTGRRPSDAAAKR
jgi:hypothetical protein